MHDYNVIEAMHHRMKSLFNFRFTFRDFKLLLKFWLFVIRAYLTVAIIFLLPVGILEALDKFLGLGLELFIHQVRPYAESDLNLIIYCVSVLSLGSLIYFLSWKVLAKEHSKYTKKLVFMGGERFRLMLKVGVACIPLTMWVYSTTNASVWAVPFRLMAKL